MRNGPNNNNNNNKRMRSRNTNNNHNNNNNNRRNQNPMTRVFESNGPDIKIRGTASHIAEKYVQLARDARTSSDPVAAENYYQHAEHYFRLIAAAQEQFRQNQPQPRFETEAQTEGSEDNEGENFSSFGAEPGFAPSSLPQPQPQFAPRESQPYQPREQHREQPPHRDRDRDHRSQPQPMDGNVDRLPSFITGGAAGGAQSQPNSPNGQPNSSGLEVNGNPGGGERFGHRRRRRPHAPRPEGQTSPSQGEDFGQGD